MKLVLKHWPIFGLLALNLILFVTNYTPGTYLAGWDNLLPELAPGMNIQRSIFAVWQEYQSLGLLGGMGHASDLIRQIYVLLLTFIFPVQLIRYITTFTFLFLGSLGAYLLVKYLLRNSQLSTFNSQLSTFTGSLFYTLNIATIQTFYAPFEAFSAHFASLPWILLSSILFVKKASFKNLLLLFFVLLLSTPSFYIPTIFIVVLIVLGIYLLTEFVLNSDRKRLVVNGIKLALIIIAVNSYWLLPFSYFTIKNSAVNVNSKINQMATPTIISQNKEFGTFQDIALLKGFWFNNVDPDINGDNRYMLARWRTHFDNPLVPATGLVLFGVIIIGFLTAVKHNKRSSLNFHLSTPFCLLFLFSFTMLATDTFPFSLFNQLFRAVPLFEQAFRFPFTKFGILAALTYSIMLAFGLSFLLQRLRNYKYGIMRFIKYSLFIIPIAAIFWMALPAFQGHLFYQKERTSIPQEYFETFDFFVKQDPNTRIANLPQPTFWGWTFYRWGMSGSGFLWYGIKQPILDRAFDVWSQNSENYYYELVSAIYSKNPQALQNILNKYQVTWILLDENVIYPSSPKSLFYDETEKMLTLLPNVKIAATFGKIKIYKVALPDNPKSFVFTISPNLPSITQPFWKTTDIAYSDLGNYISLNENSQLPASPAGRSTLNSQLIYPFGSLFSQKQVLNPGYTISQNDKTVSISTEINLARSSKIIIPEFLKHEKIVPVSIRIVVHPGSKNIELTGYLERPRLDIDGRSALAEYIDNPVFSFIFPDVASNYPINININGVSNFNVNTDSPQEIGTGFLTAENDNIIVATGGKLRQIQTVTQDDFSNYPGDRSIDIGKGSHKLTFSFNKINDSYLSYKAKGIDGKIEDCNNFRSGSVEKSFADEVANISNTNSSTCGSFYSSTLLHNLGYAIFLQATNIQNRSLHFWVLNEDEKVAPMDIYLNSKSNNNAFILPPMEENGQGYSFHFENTSIGYAVTQNILSGIEVYPIPFNFLANIAVNQGDVTVNHQKGIEMKEVSHPNESLYIVKLSKGPPSTLVLSQSYDSGWTAYSIKDSNFLTIALPFVFGNKIEQHVEVNGWANGWALEPSTMEQPASPAGGSNNGTIIIVYLPQYLEYAGFALLGIIFAFILSRFAISKLSA